MEVILYVALVLAVMVGFALTYVKWAIRARDAGGRRGLVGFTFAAFLTLLTALSVLVMRTELRFAAPLLIPVIAVALLLVCAIATEIVEVRARKTDPKVRSRLAKAAVLSFGVCLFGGALFVLAGLMSMNPDGHH